MEDEKELSLTNRRKKEGPGRTKGSKAVGPGKSGKRGVTAKISPLISDLTP